AIIGSRRADHAAGGYLVGADDRGGTVIDRMADAQAAEAGLARLIEETQERWAATMATASSSTRMDRADLQRRVRHPLDALRGYIRSYITFEGLGIALLYLALWFWIGLALDYGSYALFGFDWVQEPGERAQGQSTDIILRGVLLALLISGLIALVVWKVLWRLTREFSDPALALVLERRFPRQLGDRLITAVEMADPRMAEKYGYSQELVDK